MKRVSVRWVYWAAALGLILVGSVAGAAADALEPALGVAQSTTAESLADDAASGGGAGLVVWLLIRGTLADIKQRLDRLEALYIRPKTEG